MSEDGQERTKCKVVLLDWRKNQKTRAAFEKLGFEDNSEHEISEEAMFFIAQEFLHEGLNVIIKHHHNDGYLLGVDSYRFQQM